MTAGPRDESNELAAKTAELPREHLQVSGLNGGEQKISMPVINNATEDRETAA